MDYKQQIYNIAENFDDYKVGEIIRYNGKHTLKQESVAEHSFMTAINVIKLANLLNISDEIRDRAVTLAVLHDVSEVFIGDCGYDFKSRKEIKPVLDDLFNRYETYLYNTVYNNTIGEAYLQLIERTDVLADRLVKLSDSMGVLQFSLREKQMGNHTNDIDKLITGAKSRIDYDYYRLMEVLEHETNGNEQC